MIDYSFDVIAGCRLLQKFLKVPRIVFGIEDNKPECIERYRELVSHEQNMEVMPLKAMYPQGGEKVLIYHVTGEKVPEGKLPLDVGAVVLNRVIHASFPNSISGVIYQPGAFSCLDDGQFDEPVAESAYRAAQDALNGWDPSSGAIYYFNPNTATSAWIWSRPAIVTIGKHMFCS